MNQLEHNVTEAIADAEAGGTRTVMIPKYTAQKLLDEAREGWKWRAWSGPAVFVGMIVGFLAGVWLATSYPPGSVPHPRIDPGPATKLGTTPIEEPNMMTVSLVHRFRYQNKG